MGVIGVLAGVGPLLLLQPAVLGRLLSKDEKLSTEALGSFGGPRGLPDAHKFGTFGSNFMSSGLILALMHGVSSLSSTTNI